MKEYETLDLRVTFYVEPNPKTHEHKKFLIEKYLKEKGVRQMQQVDENGKEIYPVVVEVV